jgi:hypothetical protein
VIVKDADREREKIFKDLKDPPKLRDDAVREYLYKNFMVIFLMCLFLFFPHSLPRASLQKTKFVLCKN